MKKLSFLALAAAGLMMVGCSDKDTLVDESKTSLPNGKTEGFFKINVNLPTDLTAGTRADATTWGEADQLDDGLAAEYQIDNILLLIYDGTSESTATLKQVIQLTNTQESFEDDPNQITTRGTYVAHLNNAPTNNLYALAVVNGGTVISYNNETSVTVGGGATTTSLGASSTIENLRDASAKVTSDKVQENPFVYTKDNKKYFFMTNAVLSAKQGGTTDPTESPAISTLVPINADCIYESEAAAKAETATAAAEIFVERAMAKVTMDDLEENAITVNAGVKTKGGAAITATLMGWTLDNTNSVSYILHKVPEDQVWNLKSFAAPADKKNITDPYRFVGTFPVLSGVSLYRTYWAEDPNYNSNGTFTAATESDFSALTGNANPQYCFENTFDVNHQIHRETTRVLVKVQLSTTEDAYTIGLDKKTLFSLADVQNSVKTDLMNQAAFVEWWDNNHKDAETTLNGSDITITWEEGANNAGKKTVKAISVNSEKLKASPAAIPASVITTLNSQLGKVELYKEGVAYYQLRIKHFGDILTPWNDSEFKVDSTDPKKYAPAESTIETIYPDADDNRQDANYLGRYSMVRNNWYLISLNEIVGLGSSTIPELTAHPDDELEDLYIKARINILSWAKRPQSWNLK